MSAYASAQTGRTNPAISIAPPTSATGASSILETVIEELADRVAAAVFSRISATQEHEVAEWLDSRCAAEYLGVH